ncbi:MAG: FixH family protein [Verrucomicrobia bacterium]|nr:FixH family protein [Verrucomicrobiota bacterium]
MNSILRNPWPHAIAAWFILCIIGVVAWVSFTMRQNTELVGADYYDQEIRYQRQIERLGRTQFLTAQVTVAYDAKQRRVTVTLPGDHAAQAKGVIRFYRPSDARLDREIPLKVGAAGSQTVDSTTLRTGLWKVRVQWKVGAEEFFVDRPLVITPQS